MAFAGIAGAIPKMPDPALSDDPMQTRKYRKTTALSFSLSFDNGESNSSMDQTELDDGATGREKGKSALTRVFTNADPDPNTRVERFFMRHRAELREAMRYDHSKHHMDLGKSLKLQICASVDWEFPYLPIEKGFKFKESSDTFRTCGEQEIVRYENHIEVAPVGRQLSSSDSI